jgi:hypothetical protein
MPNCDFYAAGPDHQAILAFVVGQGDCRVFETASRPNQALREFRALADFEEYYAITDWSRATYGNLLLQLYPVKAGGKFVKERIDFKPKRSAEASFRYDAAGWGLIQLYLESPRDGRLCASHTNHNSEKRALAWESTYPRLGRVAEWNWAEVASASRRLNRFIHKMAVGKVGSRSVLAHAAQLEKSGVALD